MIRTQSAGGVVLSPRREVLVVNQHGSSWSLPKGHIEPGEDPLAAARREIHEESGIRELTLVRDLGFYRRRKIGKDGGEDAGELKTIFMFLFTTPETALGPRDPGNPEARWVPPADVAPLLTHPRDKAFFLELLPSLTMRA